MYVSKGIPGKHESSPSTILTPTDNNEKILCKIWNTCVLYEEIFQDSDFVRVKSSENRNGTLSNQN